MSDPASLSAAREKALAAFNAFRPTGMRTGNPYSHQRIIAACEAYVAALSGEPPAPTPEPATCPKCAGVGGDAGGTACDLCGGTGRAPAAPTAATPESDPEITQARKRLENAYLIRWASAEDSKYERRSAWANFYAAISDWHRRTLGGEPAPTKVVRAMAYETDEDFGYDRIKADEYSMGRGNIPALILLFADKETRDRAARLRSQHPEGGAI